MYKIYLGAAAEQDDSRINSAASRFLNLRRHVASSLRSLRVEYRHSLPWQKYTCDYVNAPLYESRYSNCRIILRYLHYALLLINLRHLSVLKLA